MASEEDRARLIGEIARILREGDPVPDDARAAALTFIGWLARRKRCERPHAAGVAELLGRGACEAANASRPLSSRRPRPTFTATAELDGPPRYAQGPRRAR